MNPVRRTIVRGAALAAVLLGALPGRLAAQGLLDGRRFVADMGPKDKPADELGDLLTFAEGRFHSKVCDKYQFDKGGYRAVREGDAIAFETETVSGTDGRIVWRGRIRGDEIEGTYVYHRRATWFRGSPEPLEYWFRGRAAP